MATASTQGLTCPFYRPVGGQLSSQSTDRNTRNRRGESVDKEKNHITGIPEDSQRHAQGKRESLCSFLCILGHRTHTPLTHMQSNWKSHHSLELWAEPTQHTQPLSLLPRRAGVFAAAGAPPPGRNPRVQPSLLSPAFQKHLGEQSQQRSDQTSPLPQPVRSSASPRH